MLVIDVGATGRNIKKILDRKNISICQISEKLGLSVAAPYKWIKGACLPSIDVLVNLAFILEVDIEDILVCRCMQEETCSEILN